MKLKRRLRVPPRTDRCAGTITLLVTRADEETGRYRSELAVLEQYGHTHQIPQVGPEV